MVSILLLVYPLNAFYYPLYYTDTGSTVALVIVYMLVLQQLPKAIITTIDGDSDHCLNVKTKYNKPNSKVHSQKIQIPSLFRQFTILLVID